MENKKIKIAISLFMMIIMLSTSSAVFARTPTQPWHVTMHNVDLTLTESAFSPQNFTAKVGDEITLMITNRDYPNMDDHNVRLRAPDGTTVALTALADPGETVSITFTPTQVGQYRFSCAVGCVVMSHMVGTYAGRITVTA